MRSFVLQLLVSIICIWSLLANPSSVHAQETPSSDALRSEIAADSAAVCADNKTEPTDPNLKKIFDEKKNTLNDEAKTLLGTLDQEEKAIDQLATSASNKALLKQCVEDQKQSLIAACPSLPSCVTNQTAKAVPGRMGVSLSPTQLQFSHQTVQTESTPQSVTVTNTSSNSVSFRPRLEPVDIGNLSGVSNFRITDNSCSNTLAPGASCTFKVEYVPFSWAEAEQQSYIALVPAGQEPVFEDLATKLAQSKRTQKLRNALNGVQQFKVSQSADSKDLSQQLHSLTQAISNNSDLQTTEQTEQDQFQALANQFNIITVAGIPDHWKYPLTRAVVGVDLSAPTSRTVKQAYFIDFDLLAPLPVLKQNNDPLENRLWVWLNPRITSLPQAANFSALSTINETGSFFDQLQNQGKLGDIAQGLDVNGGIEVALKKPRSGIPWWAEYTNTEAKLGVSLIGGLGLSTPFSTDNTDVVSQVNQSICDAFKTTTRGAKVSDQNGLVCTFPSATATSPVVIAPDGTQKTFIDFVTPDRSRFFRRFYAGFRLKTFFFSKNIRAECDPPLPAGESCDAPYDIFPGVLDFSVGKDEAVTGGHMTTWLFRTEAVYPLPFYQGIHVFGSVYTAMSRHQTMPLASDQPFNNYTIQAPSPGSNNDLNTNRFDLRPLSRDYFRIGIGVDLIQVFKKAAKGGQPTDNAPAPQSQKQTGTPTTPSPGSGTNNPAPPNPKVS